MTLSDSAARVVTSDSVIDGPSKGQLSVDGAATVTIRGDHDGAITVGTGSTVVILGSVTGSVTVESLGTVIVQGDLVGSVDVLVAGTVLVEESGRLAGPVSNFGSFRNRGLRTGPVEGRVPDDQPGSREITPSGPGASYNYRLPER